MCKVYNQIGSLTSIKSHLHNHNLNDFKSLNELIEFQRNYSTKQKEIFSNHSIIIENEKNEISIEIPQLEDFIETKKNECREKLDLELCLLRQQLSNINTTKSNIVCEVSNYFKRRKIKREILNLENNFDTKIAHSVEQFVNALSVKIHRYQYLVNNFVDAVDQSSLLQLKELEKTKRIIDEIYSSIFGAFGEQKVSNELEKLSDEYILINDFNCTFRPSLYYRQEDDYIRSVQIDHILIAPAGMFLIETKNWSEHSLNNFNLRSPVKQIRRTGFAVFNIAAEGITNSLDQHHWGSRKIPIRNIIVLVNQKPNEEFQFVKVLMLKELRDYVEYFKPCFSKNETQMIAEYLLRLNGREYKNKSRNSYP